ncbi:recombinase family protein [Streptomyces sp. N2-109]|uniref:Recombinase family protein n=1 Tax=Streptomyces gossypii TaxID=2883101 RepID=A0ABT2K236_9ACTN|nr:recombinase family protein [Streptomyces gossypii]MCT2594218.1 recombinase family protein [Streptomyces gossypii]
MADTPRRAAIYCRISRDDDSSTSIETQERDGRAWCELRGYEVAMVVHDVGVSGSIRPEEREGFKKILAELHGLDVVVARSVDRFSRVTGHFASLVETLDKRHTTLADVHGQADLTSPYGRFVVTLMVAFAQLERETIQQRILRSRTALQKGGKWGGGAAPYGFRLVPHPEGGKRLAVDPVPAGVLRGVIRRVTAGLSLTREVDRLNREGVLSPGDLRKGQRGELPPPAPGYGIWTYSPLYQLLRSEVLRGYRVMGKRETRRVVRDEAGEPVRVGPPLVTDQEWNALQRALDASGQTNRKPHKRDTMLLHVAWCPHCDGTLYFNTRNQKGKDSSFYSCMAYRGIARNKGCPGVAVSARLIEQRVEDWLLDSFGHVGHKERVLVGGGSAVPKIDELRADVEELARALVGLRGAAADAVTAQLIARQETLEAALAAPADEPRWELRPTGVTVAERWQKSDSAEKRLMLLDMRVRAEVLPPEEGRRWTPERVRVGVYTSQEEDHLAELESIITAEEAGGMGQPK